MLDPEQRYRSILERLFNIRAVLGSFQAHPESLTDGASLLLEDATRILRRLFRVFTSKWKYYAFVLTGQPKDDALTSLSKDIGDLLRVFALAAIPTLEGAEPENIPFEIEPLLGNAVSSIVPTGEFKAMILTSTHAYNYSVMPFDVSAWDDAISKIEHLPDPESARHRSQKQLYVVLTLPRTEQDSIPLHTVMLGHEVGHVRWWYVADQLRYPRPTELDIDDLHTRRLVESQPVYFEKVIHNWAREIAADVFSVLMVGPAALFALGELASILGELDNDSSSHPAPDRRFAVMIKVLHRTGLISDPTTWAEAADEGLTAVELMIKPFHEVSKDSFDRPVAWFAGPSLGERTVFQHIADAVWTEVIRLLPSMFDTCFSAMGSEEPFSLADWDAAEVAADDFESGFPPGENFNNLGKPVAVPSSIILNAAWVVKAKGAPGLRHHLGLDDSAGSLLKVNTVLNQLALKAHEIAGFRKMQT